MASIWEVIGAAGNILDLPGSSVRDALALENPFDQWLTPTTGDNRVGGRQLLDKWGITPENEETGMAGWLDNPMEGVRDVAGFAVEATLDPLNLVSGSAIARAFKGGVAARKANAVRTALLESPERARVLGEMGQAFGPAANPTMDVLDSFALGQQGMPPESVYSRLSAGPVDPRVEDVLYQGEYEPSLLKGAKVTQRNAGLYDLKQYAGEPADDLRPRAEDVLVGGTPDSYSELVVSGPAAIEVRLDVAEDVTAGGSNTMRFLGVGGRAAQGASPADVVLKAAAGHPEVSRGGMTSIAELRQSLAGEMPREQFDQGIRDLVGQRFLAIHRFDRPGLVSAAERASLLEAEGNLHNTVSLWASPDEVAGRLSQLGSGADQADVAAKVFLDRAFRDGADSVFVPDGQFLSDQADEIRWYDGDVKKKIGEILGKHGVTGTPGVQDVEGGQLSGTFWEVPEGLADDAEDVMNKGQTLYQPKRGQAAFSGDSARLSPLDNPDFSTPLHESGHVMRRMLGEANPDLAQRAVDLFGGGQQWDRAAEERFAQGLERYAQTAQPGSPALRQTMDKFRPELDQVYKDSPLADLTREQTALYDEILGIRGQLSPLDRRRSPSLAKPMLTMVLQNMAARQERM